MVARSTVTAQGQTSVPAEVRKKFGIRPGSVLEWIESEDQLVVRRVGKYTLKDVHAAAFPKGPPKAKTLAQLKAGIEKYIREKHARR
jgi:AbrB family looped-hinge helix DNA binding protein